LLLYNFDQAANTISEGISSTTIGGCSHFVFVCLCWKFLLSRVPCSFVDTIYKYFND
jgi:hypothetical protein